MENISILYLKLNTGIYLEYLCKYLLWFKYDSICNIHLVMYIQVNLNYKNCSIHSDNKITNKIHFFTGAGIWSFKIISKFFNFVISLKISSYKTYCLLRILFVNFIIKIIFFEVIYYIYWIYNIMNIYYIYWITYIYIHTHIDI